MKKYLLVGLSVAFMSVPAFAQVSATTSATTTATTTVSTQSFTVCQQAAIEKRDTAMGNARTTYNTAITVALSARKDAEKAAVTIVDPTAKVAAIKVAAENYKKAVVAAQATLASVRKASMATYETDASACRSAKKDDRRQFVTEKKAEIKNLQDERKAAVTEKRGELKSIRDSFKEKIDELRSFFRRGEITVNASTTASTTVSH